MKLNRTGSNWNELERSKINENWDIIEGLGGTLNKIASGLNWKEPVDSVADLPEEASDGDTRMVREVGPDGLSYVYRYDGEKWEKIQAIDATLVNEVDRRLSAQLADKANDIDNLNIVKADKVYTESELQRINRRINDIITTPAEGISEQEIIDARESKTSLGNNIRDIREIAETGIFNEVLNGDFRDGVSGYFFNLGSGTVTNNVMTLTSNGTTETNGTQLTYVINDNIPTTGKWLVYANVKTLDKAAAIIIGFDSSAGGFVDTNVIHAPINNQWYKMSHIIDFSDVDVSGNAGKLRVRISSTYPSNQNNEKKVEVRNIIAINLTKAFGAGRELEPDKIIEIINDVGGYFHEDIGGKLTKSLFNEVDKVRQDSKSDLINYIDNGDFSDGLTDWTASNRAILSLDTASKAIIIKRGGNSTVPQALQFRDDNSYKVGDKIFFKADFWANHSDVEKAGFYFHSDLFGNDAIGHTVSIDRSKWVSVYYMLEIPSNWTGRLRFYLRGVFKQDSDVDASLRARNIVGVNLTKMYGKGNEPSAEKFNDFIESFDEHIKNPSNKEFSKALSRYVFNKKEEGGGKKRPLVCITIDDGTETDYSVFYPELMQRGMVATSYIIGSRIGTSGYITVEQMKEMKINGWGIEGHTYEHKRLTEETDEEVRRQIVENDNFFDSIDLPKPNHIALPYGVVSESGRSIIAEYRKTIRNVSGTSSDTVNDWDNIDFQKLNAVNIDTFNVRGVLDKIDEAIERNAIIILFGHRVGDDNYQTPLSTLITILDYIEEKELQTYTIHEMYKQVLDYKNINE